MFTAEDFSPLFDNNDMDALALAQCNTLGRWPILPLSATLDGLADGSLSDDASSPITPLDAFNLGVHNLFTQQQQDPFGPPFGQCLPMSALYAPPLPAAPSDIETASTSEDSDSESGRQTTIAPIVPSQGESASKKRAASSDGAPAAKKPRVVNTRVRAKDFVPPDVSGLTKREARLVKNRAAAFLSRQRKREEFEAMEIRLAELERENADLRRPSQGESVDMDVSEDASAGDEQQLAALRSLLQAAKDREAALQLKLDAARSNSSRSPSPLNSSDEQRPTMGLMAMLSATSWARELAGADSWVTLCDSANDTAEVEISTTSLVDGKLRVSIRRPTAQPSAKDDQNQKRMRLCLARAELGDEHAELDVEVR